MATHWKPGMRARPKFVPIYPVLRRAQREKDINVGALNDLHTTLEIETITSPRKSDESKTAKFAGNPYTYELCFFNPA